MAMLESLRFLFASRFFFCLFIFFFFFEILEEPLQRLCLAGAFGGGAGPATCHPKFEK